jgi:hypothetical protein
VHFAAFVAIALGAWVVQRRDHELAHIGLCTFLVPVGLAAGFGLVAPVLLDRTLTIVAWAPLLAVAYLIDELLRRTARLAVVTAVVIAVAMATATIGFLTRPSAPDTVLRHLAQVSQRDNVAVFGSGKKPELIWSIGVRSGLPFTHVRAGLRHAYGIHLGSGSTGVTWVLTWRPGLDTAGFDQCAPTWRWAETTILCLRR